MPIYIDDKNKKEAIDNISNPIESFDRVLIYS